MLLADSLRVLLEHGLLSNGRPVSITEGCLPAWRKWGLSGRGLDALGSTECPAWRVLMYYYKMKVSTSKPWFFGEKEEFPKMPNFDENPLL